MRKVDDRVQLSASDLANHLGCRHLTQLDQEGCTVPDVRIEHFERAAQDIGTRGDNDTLPFDVDNRFVKEECAALSSLTCSFCEGLENKAQDDVIATIYALQIFSERLLVPTGSSGFRITTKIHPFWTVYLNGLGIAIAEKHEPE